MKILYSIWFTATTCIGIVITENEIGERKVRMGLASGFDEQADARRIAETGCRISVDILENIIKVVKEEK